MNKRNEARNMCEFDAYRCLTEIPSFTWCTYIPTESHFILDCWVRSVRLSEILKKLEVISNSDQGNAACKALLTFLPKLLHWLNFLKWVKNDNIIIIEWVHSTPLNRSALCGNSSRNAYTLTEHKKLLTVNWIRKFLDQIFSPK